MFHFVNCLGNLCKGVYILKWPFDKTFFWCFYVLIEFEQMLEKGIFWIKTTNFHLWAKNKSLNKIWEVNTTNIFCIYELIWKTVYVFDLMNIFLKVNPFRNMQTFFWKSRTFFELVNKFWKQDFFTYDLLLKGKHFFQIYEYFLSLWTKFETGTFFERRDFFKYKNYL